MFVDRTRAATLLAQPDEFTLSLSEFDRAARARRIPPPNDEQIRAHFAAQALDWPPERAGEVEASAARIGKKLASFEHWLPERIELVAATNASEEGAAHTRGMAVIVPLSALERSGPELDSLLVHELFHILSRHNPALRDRLYGLIGFQPCPGFQIPSELRNRVITNPDAPRVAHAIRVESRGIGKWVAPVLLADPPRYDPQVGGDLFVYLTVRFIPVSREAELCQVEAGAGQQLFAAEQLSGLSEQIGENTTYTIHPEEILADNFSLLVNGARNLPTPELIARLRELMSAHAR